MAKAVVADAAPIIALARIDQLGLLPVVLGVVVVPETVAGECLAPGMPGAEAIADAFARGVLSRRADVAGNSFAFPQLGAGEAAAILLARELGAAVLMDERVGRAVARRMGLAVIGSLGVLIAAKQRKLIGSVAAVIEQMRGNGYYIAESLVSEALRLAGE